MSHELSGTRHRAAGAADSDRESSSIAPAILEIVEPGSTSREITNKCRGQGRRGSLIDSDGSRKFAASFEVAEVLAAEDGKTRTVALATMDSREAYCLLFNRNVPAAVVRAKLIAFDSSQFALLVATAFCTDSSSDF